MRVDLIAELALRDRVADFLAAARSAASAGDIAAISALCDFPVAIVAAKWRREIKDMADLAGYVATMQASEAAFSVAVWYQDIVSVDPLDDDLLDCKINIHWVDARGQRSQVLRQTVILRRSADYLQFVAIINPIRRGFWQKDSS